jgi:hypothetical protein
MKRVDALLADYGSLFLMNDLLRIRRPAPA